MKLAHVTLDPATAQHLALVTGEGIAAIRPRMILRCGAYRFEVLERAKEYPEAPEPTVALRLDVGQHPPHEGMIVHLAAERLTDEEFETAVQHLIMAERMLLGIDAEGVLARLQRAGMIKPIAAQMAGVTNTVEMLARAVQAALLRLPGSNRAGEVQRYASELTRVTADG